MGQASSAATTADAVASASEDTDSTRIAVSITAIECSSRGPRWANAEVTAAPMPRSCNGISRMSEVTSAKLSSAGMP